MDESRRQELEKAKKEIETQLADIAKRSTDFGSDVDDNSTESHETEEIDIKLAMEQSLKERLAEIERELASD